MVATVRCAPPANRPTPEERDTCGPWIRAEIAMLAPHLRVVVALGGYRLGRWRSAPWPRPATRSLGRDPKFGHGVEVTLASDDRSVVLLGCYHPSQQNTFTGRLTAPMLDGVLGRAATLGGARMRP